MILITNDDGIFARGINVLAEIASSFDDVCVVAPEKVRSACSSSITVSEPLRMSKVAQKGNIAYHSLSGTPTDCIKFATDVILAKETPKLILSGINHGSNVSINSIYSGTVSAVLEGCVKGIPSVAFSILSTKMEISFEECVPFVKKIINFVLANPLPKGTCLNVNFPVGELKGMKMARQANACWLQEIELRMNGGRRGEYWIGGKFENREKEATDTDIWAVDNGYVSVVPLKIDYTDYDYLKYLKSNEL